MCRALSAQSKVIATVTNVTSTSRQPLQISTILAYSGGFKEAARGVAEMEKAGLEARWVQGRRYTDDATLEIVARVLAEEINEDIVRHIRKFGGRASGGADFVGDGNVVETFISYLRKKVDVEEPPLIQTVRGFGYTLRLTRG